MTINIPADCSPAQFKRDLDKAIAGLQRMRKVMFGAVPAEVKRAWKGRKR